MRHTSTQKGSAKKLKLESPTEWIVGICAQNDALVLHVVLHFGKTDDAELCGALSRLVAGKSSAVTLATVYALGEHCNSVRLNDSFGCLLYQENVTERQLLQLIND